MSKFILITQPDLERIGDHLRAQQLEAYDELRHELDRAQVIAEHEAPVDLVKMNGTVTYYNEEDDKLATITLVYPNDSNWTQGRISVLAPLGSALLGLREGHSIYWTFPGGTKKLTVIEVHPPSDGQALRPQRAVA